jgi:hypothetical protein
VRGLKALTGHLGYAIGQIKPVLSALSALSALVEAVSAENTNSRGFRAQPTAMSGRYGGIDQVAASRED